MIFPRVMVVLAWCTAATVHADDRESYRLIDNINEYPYMAVVMSKAGVCAGVIITNDYVLTAAHCVYNSNRRATIEKDAVRVLAGTTTWEDQQWEMTKVESKNQRVYIHPYYKHEVPSKYDVALIKLLDPFPWSAAVGNVSVSNWPWPQTNNQAMKCVALGFGGYYSTSMATKQLKTRNLTAVHGEKACPCAMRFQAKRMVCVHEKNHAMMCLHDDGGPLVCEGKVVGVGHMVWNVYTCGDIKTPSDRCLSNPDPGLSMYFYLCPVLDWLNSISKDIPKKSPEGCDGSTVMPSILVLVLLLLLCFTNY